MKKNLLTACCCLFIIASSAQALKHKFDFVRSIGFGQQDGQLKWGHGLAGDAQGNLYVAETGSHRVQVFNSSGAFVRQFGSYGKGNGQFNRPEAVAVALDGTIYVSDTENQRVQIFDNVGKFIKEIKVGSAPYGIGVDQTGNFYTALRNKAKVAVYNTTTAQLVREFGIFGSGEGQFSLPVTITLGQDGKIYVADEGQITTQIFTNTGTFLLRIGAPGSAENKIQAPKGIAINPNGDLYVSDYFAQRLAIYKPDGTFHQYLSTPGKSVHDLRFNALGNEFYFTTTNEHAVYKMSISGGVPQLFCGAKGTGDLQFDWPNGMAIDQDHNVHIHDSFNSRVQVVSADGAFIRHLPAGTNSTGFIPTFLDFDNDGNRYISSFSRVSKFDSNTTPMGVLSSLGKEDGQFNSITGFRIRNNKLFLADPNNKRVQVLSTSFGYLSKFTIPTLNDVGTVTSMDVDANENIYYVDLPNRRIVITKSSGEILRTFGSLGTSNGQFQIPTQITLDSNGNVYVYDLSRNDIQVFDNNGTFLGKIISEGDAQFENVVAMTVDDQERVYISDPYRNRVLVFQYSVVVGLEEEGKVISRVSVFPNPAKSLLSVTVKGSTPYKIVMHDVLGRPVFYSTGTSAEPVHINTESMGRGVYFITATSAGMPSVVTRVVLQ